MSFRYFKTNVTGGFRLTDLNKDLKQGQYFYVENDFARTSRAVQAALKHKWIVEVNSAEAGPHIQIETPKIIQKPQLTSYLQQKIMGNQQPQKLQINVAYLPTNFPINIVYTKINLMLPTYKRSSTMLPKFVNSAIEQMSSKDNICFTFCVNINDKETIDYLNSRLQGFDYELIFEDLPKPHLGKFFNMMYVQTQFRDPSILVTMLGDDMIFMTKNYDVIILSKINEVNGLGLIYCDDNYLQHEKLCVNLFTTRRIVEATKKEFMSDLFPMDMIDLIWMRIGERTNLLKYLSNVIIHHEHSTKVQQDKQDETFKRLYAMWNESHDKTNLVDQYVNESVNNLIANLK